MTTPRPADLRVSSESFAYFMIRVQRPANPDLPTQLCGVIERLGTGEKLRFDDAAELVQLLTTWRATQSQPASALIKDPGSNEPTSPLTNAIP